MSVSRRDLLKQSAAAEPVVIASMNGNWYKNGGTVIWGEKANQPKDAGLDALNRVRSNTVERRLRHPDGEPDFSLTFHVLNAKGGPAGVSMYAEDDDCQGWGENSTCAYMKYAVGDRNGPRGVVCL